MEEFIIGKKINESLCAEAVRRAKDFMGDARRILSANFVTLELIDKTLIAISGYEDALIALTPKNDDENRQIKDVLQDLSELKSHYELHKTVQ